MKVKCSHKAFNIINDSIYNAIHIGATICRLRNNFFINWSNKNDSPLPNEWMQQLYLLSYSADDLELALEAKRNLYELLSNQVIWPFISF